MICEQTFSWMRGHAACLEIYECLCSRVPFKEWGERSRCHLACTRYDAELVIPMVITRALHSERPRHLASQLSIPKRKRWTKGVNTTICEHVSGGSEEVGVIVPVHVYIRVGREPYAILHMWL